MTVLRKNRRSLQRPPVGDAGGRTLAGMGFATTGSATAPAAGYHRLPLPAPAVRFSSAQGKQLLRKALLHATAECYFRLAEAFHTQSEPAYCGLATLVMVLNALEVDPGAKWKDNWRWYDEEMFHCCVDLDEIKKDGITWRPWCKLAREHGLDLKPQLATNTTIDAFREAVRTATASDSVMLIVNYGRGSVNQAGNGHFSPIGAYVADEDMVLVFDVARFKHPPHWLPIESLWQAMVDRDPVTGFGRGFALASREHDHTCDGGQVASCIQLTCGHGRLAAAHQYFGGDDIGGGALDRSCPSCPACPSQSCADPLCPAAPPPSAPEAAATKQPPAGGRSSGCGGRSQGCGRSSAAAATKRLHPLMLSRIRTRVAAMLRHSLGHTWRRCDDASAPPFFRAVRAEEAARGAKSAEEEVWLAMRSLPCAAAALTTVRDADGDDGDGDADDANDGVEEARARLRQSRDELRRTRVHRALTEAEATFRKRDGPLPDSIDACAALLLLLHAIVPAEKLRHALPRSAPLILDEEPLLVEGGGSTLAADVHCSRGVLSEKISSHKMGRLAALASTSTSLCVVGPPDIETSLPIGLPTRPAGGACADVGGLGVVAADVGGQEGL